MQNQLVLRSLGEQHMLVDVQQGKLLRCGIGAGIGHRYGRCSGSTNEFAACDTDRLKHSGRQLLTGNCLRRRCYCT